jgi:hypothetical protein
MLWRVFWAAGRDAKRKQNRKDKRSLDHGHLFENLEDMLAGLDGRRRGG